MRSEPEWPVLRGLIRSWTGVCLAERNAHSSLRALAAVSERHGASASTFLARVSDTSNGGAREALIDAITIGTSWWMRERAKLDAVVELMLQHCQETGIAAVRVWSAGCSTGQEPYSIAMLLLEAGLRPTVLATDVNRGFLRLAARGQYNSTQLRGLPEAMRDRYFSRTKHGDWTVGPVLRRTVAFSRHNLLTDPVPRSGGHSFDVVVSRNVLIYFEAIQAVEISRKLVRAHRRGGTLILGAVEQPLVDMLDPGTRPLAPSVPSLPSLASLSAGAGLTSAPPLRPSALPSASRGRQSEPAVSIEPERLEEMFRALAARRPELARDAEELARVHPLVPAVHLLRGLAQKQCGFLRVASDSFRRACFLDHGCWMAPYQLGLCLEQLGDRKAALLAYRDAMRVLDDGGPSGLPGQVALGHESAARTVADSCGQRIRALSGGAR